MKWLVLWVAFLAADWGAFMAVPADVRAGHAWSVLPGGGFALNWMDRANRK